MSHVTISQLAPHQLSDVGRLCEQELTLDRSAGSIPRIVTRQPYLGLVAVQDSATVGACIGSVAQSGDGNAEGFIDLLVVDRALQRHGIGPRLASELERQLAARGCQRIDLSGGSPNNAWPGVDIHYTSAVCLAEDSGYQRQGCEVNMDVDLLRAPLDTRAAEDRLASEGIEVRRADGHDDGPLQELLASTWQASWIAEITEALRSSEAGLYLALQSSRYVGFCCYGLNRGHEVGPIGTDPGMRGRGIGAVLLKRCLAEQRSRGIDAAELVWVGPLSYFARVVHATIGRAFWRYSKDLSGAGRAPDWRDRIGLI
ncbi:MAG TPA: GNAT family N-acetyltransferase [Streptosporangiaceae bacterium]|nr:GNAT family N-acetyltransferase [Streptosporangiaceae bacterium]